MIVAEKNQINFDVYSLVLQFDNPEWVHGLWPGGHFVFTENIDGHGDVSRKYTPITCVPE